jgi:hypothetical protein
MFGEARQASGNARLRPVPGRLGLRHGHGAVMIGIKAVEHPAAGRPDLGPGQNAVAIGIDAVEHPVREPARFLRPGGIAAQDGDGENDRNSSGDRHGLYFLRSASGITGLRSL